MDAGVAIVTGAARGIGAAIAGGLASDGWRVVLVDRCADDPALPYRLATPADLDEAVRACGDAAVGIVGDVRSTDDLDAAVAVAVERFGGLDAAVAAAGVLAGGPPAWEERQQSWDTQIGVNLTGVWNLARAAVPVMLRRPAPRSGRFVAVSSAAALGAHDRLAAYSASKAGVLGLVRSLAADLRGSGITANTVCPGSTRTALLDTSAAVYDLHDAESFAGHHLVDRLLEPTEIAAAVVWLCSATASGVTGAAVPVDGGMTA